jgi:hypothetical protein
MRDLKPIEMDAVSGGDFDGGDFDFDLNKKNPNKKPKQPQDKDSTLEEVVAYGRRFFGSWRVRLIGAMGFGVGTELMVREVIDKNGDIIEEVLVVADKIDGSDVPPASVLFGPAKDVSITERTDYWRVALENMSPEELRLIARDMDALKTGHEVTAALDAIITQVQAALNAAAQSAPGQRGDFASSISQNIGFNTTLINWGGLACWWVPR